MKDIMNLLSDYYETCSSIKVLLEKKRRLREELLLFLDENKVDRMHIPPYRFYYYEHPRYSYNIMKMFEILQPKDLFLNIIEINQTNYRDLLTSNRLEDEDVENLLKLRFLESIYRAFYVRRTE